MTPKLPSGFKTKEQYAAYMRDYRQRRKLERQASRGTYPAEEYTRLSKLHRQVEKYNEQQLLEKVVVEKTVESLKKHPKLRKLVMPNE